jgi:hypothetical protein
MDHLLNNADKAIPEGGADYSPADVDDDDEDAAQAHIKKMGGNVDDADLVAKVRPRLTLRALTVVDQVQRMWKDLQIASYRQLPRGEIGTSGV